MTDQDKGIPDARESKKPLHPIERGQQIIDQLKQLDFTKPDQSTKAVVAEFKEQTAIDLIAGWEKQKEFLKESYTTIHNQVVAMQCAYIDAHYGKGAHHAIGTWVTNFLAGPGHIPANDDGSEPTDAQEWHNNEKLFYTEGLTFPKCWCGKSSSICGHHNGVNTGWCSDEHNRQTKEGVAALPKPQKISVPMSYIRALLYFASHKKGSYQDYVIFQVDKAHNLLVTAHAGAISAQYQPGEFNTSCVIENILLFAPMLKYITENCDFNQLELTRLPNGNWAFYKADFELHLKPANSELVPEALLVYFKDIKASPELPDVEKSRFEFDQKYLDLMSDVAKVFNENTDSKGYQVISKSCVHSIAKEVIPLALIAFDGVPDFKAVIAPRRVESDAGLYS